jgi:hypothetical protein
MRTAFLAPIGSAGERRFPSGGLSPIFAAMHRIRVGLIGLAWVFLLVMVATAFLHATGSDRIANDAAQNADAPSEPLAELGVAPGNPAAEAAPAPVPAPSPAAAKPSGR